MSELNQVVNPYEDGEYCEPNDETLSEARIKLTCIEDVVSAALRWREFVEDSMDFTCDCPECELYRAVNKYREATNG